jgi:hypothetical protein
LASGAAGSRDGNLHTESYLPEQTAVDGLGRTDTPEHRLKGNGLFLSEECHLVPDGSGLPSRGLDCLVAFFTEEFLCNSPVNECVLTWCEPGHPIREHFGVPIAVASIEVSIPSDGHYFGGGRDFQKKNVRPIGR